MSIAESSNEPGYGEAVDGNDSNSTSGGGSSTGTPGGGQFTLSHSSSFAGGGSHHSHRASTGKKNIEFLVKISSFDRDTSDYHLKFVIERSRVKYEYLHEGWNQGNIRNNSGFGLFL